ncbi:MAG: hypothetical protein ACT4QB_17390 [Gammaproteobacteria bacterium]
MSKKVLLGGRVAELSLKSEVEDLPQGTFPRQGAFDHTWKEKGR